MKLKRLTSGALLMSLVPLSLDLVNYQWSLSQHLGQIEYSIFLILWTITASPPYAIATSLVFLGLVLGLTRKKYSWKIMVLFCLMSLGSTQAVKAGMKLFFAEPRPYVIEMNEKGDLAKQNLTLEKFVVLPEKEQAEIVFFRAQNLDEQAVTSLQSNELGYTFPSGHTIFAVSWLLILWYFPEKSHFRHRIIQAMVAIWAILILYSRALLGMHFSADLWASIWIAWAIHVLLFYFLEVKFNPSFKSFQSL